jgi:hypothetical protein
VHGVAGHGDKLSRKQEQALAALLELPTIAAAADKVGIGERTLRNWLKLPAFQAAWRDARRQVVEESVALLQRIAAKAVATVHRNLDCNKPAVEVAAAFGVLDRAVKGVELVELVERIEALERAEEARKARGGR